MPTTPGRDGSKSICTKVEYKPVHYHWYRRGENRSLIAEVRALVAAAGLSQSDAARVLGEFRALVRLLQDGQLIPVEHVKGPMASVKDLVVFEIFTNTEIQGEEKPFAVRAYHVEPKFLQRIPASTIVGLHVHSKDLTDDTTVNALQNQELQEARKRFHEGRADRWGGASLLPLQDLVS